MTQQRRRTDADGLAVGVDAQTGVGPNPAEAARERERLVARECAVCGGPITLAPTGRPPTVCSPACRQRRWALRAAAAQLGHPELAEPRVVREVVERTVTVERDPHPAPHHHDRPGERVELYGVPEISGPGRTRWTRTLTTMPLSGPEWTEMLGVLVAQLDDPDCPTARDHAHHKNLLTALGQAVTALDRAHPDQLIRRRPR